MTPTIAEIVFDIVLAVAMFCFLVRVIIEY